MEVVIPDKHPEACNLCSSRNVEIGSNEEIFGKKYGNGKIFICRDCGAYVGCHDNGDALGFLSDKEMRRMKTLCHKRFDIAWKSNKLTRSAAYERLSNILEIPVESCHFGYFDKNNLKEVLSVLKNPNWYSE